jgi:hypothetical protein
MGYNNTNEEFDPLSSAVSVHQSSELDTIMARLKMYFALVTEADRRTVIDVVLLDAMWAADTQLGEKRKVFVCINFQRWCEVPDGNAYFFGHLDYTIADWSGRIKPIAPYFLLLEAKREYDINRDQFQLLAEMAVVMEKNQKSHPEKPIYGALTNAENWKFYKMMPDKKWASSRTFLLTTELEQIFQMLVSLIANGHH